MLDIQQAPNKQFLKLVRQPEEESTQKTELMTALRYIERTSSVDVHATDEQPTPEELEEDNWLREPLITDRKPSTSALEELRKLADLAVLRTEQRYREEEQRKKIMQELEALASKLPDEEIIEKQPTAYMPVINPITPIPPSIQEKSEEPAQDSPNLSNYYMKDISPLMLIWSAIGEHMSKYDNRTPLCVYVSKKLILLLSDDVKRIMGNDVIFSGYVPFPTPEGTVPISVKSKETLGISIHKVECIS